MLRRRAVRRSTRSSRTRSRADSTRSSGSVMVRHLLRALPRLPLPAGRGQGGRAEPVDGGRRRSAPWCWSSRTVMGRSCSGSRRERAASSRSCPILAFCIVFGLSMDYEVFLVSRVAEARRSGLSESEAIVEGLARTGSVITSAGSIMIAVFASFAMGAFLPVQMLGFVLTVAVLLDATVVRMVIGPALLRLAGKWNWWPGESRSSAQEIKGRGGMKRFGAFLILLLAAWPLAAQATPATLLRRRFGRRRSPAAERCLLEGAGGWRHRRHHEALCRGRGSLSPGREGRQGSGGDPLQVERPDRGEQDQRDGPEGREVRRLAHGLRGMGRRLDASRAQERKAAEDDPGTLLDRRGETQREVGLRVRRNRRARRDPHAGALLSKSK